MDKEEILKRARNEKKDEYEEKSKSDSNKLLIVLIFAFSVFAGIIRSSRGGDFKDIIMIFCGSVGIQQLYMYHKTRDAKGYLIIAIILLAAAVISCIKIFL